MAFRDQYAIAGLGLTAFGRLPGRSAVSIKAEAITRAIQDAGLEPDRHRRTDQPAGPRRYRQRR